MNIIWRRQIITILVWGTRVNVVNDLQTGNYNVTVSSGTSDNTVQDDI